MGNCCANEQKTNKVHPTVPPLPLNTITYKYEKAKKQDAKLNYVKTQQIKAKYRRIKR